MQNKWWFCCFEGGQIAQHLEVSSENEKNYVQSRGISQDNDYRWLKIRNNNQIPEVPSIFKRQLPGKKGAPVRLTDLIESQTPSMILARSDMELCLLVTGLEAREERTDFMGRRVRNSVAWMYPDSDENERYLRAITVRALERTLQDEVDRAIEVGGECGFKVSLKAISNISNSQEVGIFEPD